MAKAAGLENPFKGLIDHLIAGPVNFAAFYFRQRREKGYFSALIFKAFRLMLTSLLEPVLPYSASSGCLLAQMFVLSGKS